MPDHGMYRLPTGQRVYVVGWSMDTKTGQRAILFDKGDSILWSAPLADWRGVPCSLLHIPTDADVTRMGGVSAMKFRKRPIVIEAIQWTGENNRDIHEHVSSSWDAKNGLRVHTLEGDLYATVGDWIIRGVKGEGYPCKPDIFAATYEAVQEPTP